jgi:hypothetical protein
MRAMPGHNPPEEVQALLDWAYEVWSHLGDADYSQVRTWSYLTHRFNQMNIYYDTTGNKSLYDHKGRPRPGYDGYMKLVNQIREFEKVLGIGPGPRAQIAQQLASSGKDVGLARESVARLRAKARVAPALPPTPGDDTSKDSLSLPETPSP